MFKGGFTEWACLSWMLQGDRKLTTPSRPVAGTAVHSREAHGGSNALRVVARGEMWEHGGPGELVQRGCLEHWNRRIWSLDFRKLVGGPAGSSVVKAATCEVCVPEPVVCVCVRPSPRELAP